MYNKIKSKRNIKRKNKKSLKKLLRGGNGCENRYIFTAFLEIAEETKANGYKLEEKHLKIIKNDIIHLIQNFKQFEKIKPQLLKKQCFILTMSCVSILKYFFGEKRTLYANHEENRKYLKGVHMRRFNRLLDLYEEFSDRLSSVSHSKSRSRSRRESVSTRN
tara:strand:- start:3257 stop:3742 length:486 start_codon:yes stop_codon:yes gene_type:complete